MRPAVFFRLRLRLQNTAVYLTPILSLNLEHKLGVVKGTFSFVNLTLNQTQIKKGHTRRHVL